MSVSPFPNTTSPLKERVEGEFVRRCKEVPQLRKDFPSINLQDMNQAAPAPKIVCVAAVQGKYVEMGTIFKVNLSIEIQVADPPTRSQNNAKMLEISAGAVRQVLTIAQTGGEFGVIFGQEFEKKGINTRSRILTATILTA